MTSPCDADAQLEREKGRCDLLCETAASLCVDLSEGDETFSFNRPAISELVNRYFCEVERFKKANRLTGLINRQKQAALTIRQILCHSPIRAEKNVRDSVNHSMANVWFAYRVALALLKVQLRDVEESVSEEVVRLISVRVASGECDDRTLILVMDLLHRHYAPLSEKKTFWSRMLRFFCF